MHRASKIPLISLMTVHMWVGGKGSNMHNFFITNYYWRHKKSLFTLKGSACSRWYCLFTCVLFGSFSACEKQHNGKTGDMFSKQTNWHHRSGRKKLCRINTCFLNLHFNIHTFIISHVCTSNAIVQILQHTEKMLVKHLPTPRKKAEG